MNVHLFDIGVCGYCGTMAEYWEPKHVDKCRRRYLEYRQSKDPVHQLKRIADALERKPRGGTI